MSCPGGHQPVSPQLLGGITGTGGARRAQELGKHPLGWTGLGGRWTGLRGRWTGASSLPPHFHPPSGHFPFLKWLFAGRLAERGHRL